jgi:hypothetical protein
VPRSARVLLQGKAMEHLNDVGAKVPRLYRVKTGDQAGAASFNHTVTLPGEPLADVATAPLLLIPFG